MSKLDELIRELCPDGVEYKKLGEIATVLRGASPRPIKKYITNDSDGVNWIKIGDRPGRRLFRRAQSRPGGGFGQRRRHLVLPRLRQKR